MLPLVWNLDCNPHWQCHVYELQDYHFLLQSTSKRRTWNGIFPEFLACGKPTLTSSYPHKFSTLISIHFYKSQLREFDNRSMHFPFGDHFINSHNLSSWLCSDIVRRNLMLVTVGTYRINWTVIICQLCWCVQYWSQFSLLIMSQQSKCIFLKEKINLG